MSDLIIWTYDWVPEGPRGFVRDLRLRWACEEAGRAYSVRTAPFDGRQTNHLQVIGPATETYVIRVTRPPLVKKARADQLAHFAAADASGSAAIQ